MYVDFDYFTNSQNIGRKTNKTLTTTSHRVSLISIGVLLNLYDILKEATSHFDIFSCNLKSQSSI